MGNSSAFDPTVSWVSEAAVTDCVALAECCLTIITQTPTAVSGVDKELSMTNTILLFTNFKLTSVKHCKREELYTSISSCVSLHKN